MLKDCICSQSYIEKSLGKIVILYYHSTFHANNTYTHKEFTGYKVKLNQGKLLRLRRKKEIY